MTGRRQARTGGDELADDDVLLEAQEAVLLTHRGGLGEDARGLLETCSGEERARRETRLGNAEQHGLRRGRLSARGDGPRVDVLELEPVEQLHWEQLGVAGLLDA